MKVTLPNGLTLEGTVEQVKETATALGYSISLAGYYFSTSKNEYIKISEMNENYLKNALLKLYKEWLDTVYDMKGKELCKVLTNGPTDPTFVALYTEYYKRDK